MRKIMLFLFILLLLPLIIGWRSVPEHTVFSGIAHFEGPVSYQAKTVNATGPTDDVNTDGESLVVLDTSSNNVTVGGFENGRDGQMVHIVKPKSSNNATLEDAENATTQQIYLSGGSDEEITDQGGWTLYCNGTDWIEVD